MISGFEQERLTNATAVIAGAGVGGFVLDMLARTGLGRGVNCDFDYTDPTNLPRQLLTPNDLWKNKALQVIENIAAHSIVPQTLIGCPFKIETYLERAEKNIIGYPMPDILGCFIDNEKGTLWCCDFARRHDIPCVFAKVDRQSDTGFVFIQEIGPDSACLQCVMHYNVRQDRGNPSPAGSTIDCHLTAACVAAWAMISVLMPKRGRRWTYRSWSLSGREPEELYVAEKREGCEICAGTYRSLAP